MRTLAVAVAALPLAAGAAGAASLPTRDGMVRCLRQHGAVVSAVPRTNRTLRSLSAVAQRTSFLATIERSSVGVGVAPREANALLLVEVLTNPRSGYVVKRVRNVVLLSRKSDPAAARVAAACAQRRPT
jgi:hypothetical protein